MELIHKGCGEATTAIGGEDCEGRDVSAVEGVGGCRHGVWFDFAEDVSDNSSFLG